MQLPGTAALVTGASTGIGEHLARGAHLVLAARSTATLEQLATDLRGTHPGTTVTVRTADLSEPAAPAALARELSDAGITIDLLVNNAGVGSYGPFAQDDPVAVAHQIQLNCGALVALTAQLLPGMLSRGHGGVLNVASTSAFQPTPLMAVYGATKAFVLSFTEALWVETRGTGVQVLALCPGPTSTQFFHTANPNDSFLTRGRQSPQQVAAVALSALQAGRGPTVISGTANQLSATGYRLLPRAVMARLAGRRMSHRT